MLANVMVSVTQLVQVQCEGYPMETIAGRSKYRSIREGIPEQSSTRITAIIEDEAGAVIASQNLTTLTLTLYDLTGGADVIVNSVSDVNILNTGRGTVSGVGGLVLTLTPADLAILDTTHRYEERVALLEWSYASGAKAGRHEVVLLIRNLRKVA